MAAGDPDAGLLLYQELLRTGILNPEFVADEANIRLLQGVLPPEVGARMTRNLLLANATRPWQQRGEPHGGWFPDHKSVTECPRGHEIEDAGFTLCSYEMRIAEAGEAVNGVLYVTGLFESADDAGPADWISCNACYASWPVTELDYA